jgi:hypothetical protein
MLRSQQIALYSFGFVSLIVFSAVAWFAKGNLRSSVKDQSDYWQAVSAAGWDQRIWKQSILRPPRSDGSYVEELNTNLVAVGERKITLGEFLARVGVEIVGVPGLDPVAGQLSHLRFLEHALPFRRASDSRPPASGSPCSMGTPPDRRNALRSLANFGTREPAAGSMV